MRSTKDIIRYGYISLHILDTHKEVLLFHIKNHTEFSMSTKGFISIAKGFLKRRGYKIEKI